MKMRFVSVAVCSLLFSGKAFAGWYHVENYEGFLGPNPIHFSIQTYDGFGSGITVEGSYFQDAKQTPITIYGRVSDGKLGLCEISDDKEFYRILTMGSKTPVDTSGCPFSLEMNETGATGTWSKGTEKYPVTLKKVASLDDTHDQKIDGSVDIPFWAQTATERFSGTYTSTGAGICMEKMQVIHKRSGRVAQEIRFKDEDCNAGMLMTPIYENVQKFTEKSSDTISVNFRDGRAGYSMDYVFNKKTKKYQHVK
ncbi:hypothetical protein [Mesorhizobium sp. INR15]|uniref:hypothetical protein n=1 Tax=Mesorhizobium sp. INR15 TaxID=2654248 RepID=UPI0018965242|nr:hypothetical protein [Mesorhizobium sp. INR15]QPC93653.1 hypothetical protein GA829_25445 [Mesorhizobium sp. INR15]